MSGRLVRLIETHSDELAKAVLKEIRNSPRTSDYSKVPPDELHHAILRLYQHLGDYLLTKDKDELDLHFENAGAHRAVQGVSFPNFVWAVVIAKERLWRFLQLEVPIDRPLQLLGEFELLRLLDQFFDRVLYNAALGYERVRDTVDVT